MGGDQGVQLFRDIVRTNGMQVRKGHTLLANLVAAGEIPLALTIYSYKPEQQKREGAPIEPLYLRRWWRSAMGRRLRVRAASARRAAVQRVHARRGPGDLGQARHGGDQSQDPPLPAGSTSR